MYQPKPEKPGKGLIGSVFFRRPGPQSWTGAVLDTRCRQLGVRPNPYQDEAPITVTYDEGGFRNPLDLQDWDVAVIGDSFTELGYLPDEELFTTLLGEGLGRRVKNLGVSMTGPNAQLHYLRDFGLAPGLTDVVQVFYEGNDHHDVWNERRLMRELETTGKRSERSFTRQSSLLKAIASFVEGEAPSPRGTDVTSGWFQSPAGGEVPISIYRVPPGIETGVEPMKPDARAGLEEALADYAALCRERGLRSWLVYMPVKTRVWFGMVRFTDLASDRVKAWTPTDYPEFIREICAREGIRFLDMTPIFRAVTEQEGVLVYNSIWDEHLNARGSALVAEALLDAMGPVLNSGLDGGLDSGLDSERADEGN